MIGGICALCYLDLVPSFRIRRYRRGSRMEGCLVGGIGLQFFHEGFGVLMIWAERIGFFSV